MQKKSLSTRQITARGVPYNLIMTDADDGIYHIYLLIINFYNSTPYAFMTKYPIGLDTFTNILVIKHTTIEQTGVSLSE